MATNKGELVSFEFLSGKTVVGKATWMGPGMVELDFSDPTLRQHFSRFLGEPQEHHGPVFESGHVMRFWPDESRSHFAEACNSLSNLYHVRRTA